jgi:hypothetical protein
MSGEVFTVVTMKITEMTPYNLVGRCQYFGGVCCLRLQGTRVSTVERRGTDLRSLGTKQSHDRTNRDKNIGSEISNTSIFIFRYIYFVSLPVWHWACNEILHTSRRN